MFATIDEALQYIKAENIVFIDVKVVDLQGRWRRMTYSAAHLERRFFEEGTGISLSPYPGYRQVESGDMRVIPDLQTGFVDPFHRAPTLSFLCDIHNNDGSRYVRDPRYVVRQAERRLEAHGLNARALFSPELEFYLFDGARFGSAAGSAYYELAAPAVGWSDEDHLGYPLTGFAKVGQVDQPLDRHTELRDEMVRRIEAAGIAVKYHHQELGTPGQAEIEVYFDTPLRTADSMMIMKYLIKNTALAHGAIATFMPKPLIGHAGNGLHFHQYLERDDRSLFFAEEGYGGMSSLALAYLSGLLDHTPALMAIGNASTNSYRRFTPGYSAPVKLFFGLGNRSSALRIPGYAVNEREARIEYRMPDATANPYLIVAAQLMAGLDGLERELEPGAMGFGPFDGNAFGLAEEELTRLKSVPTSFGHALTALVDDRDFLTRGAVFSDELIDAYVKVKRELEIADVNSRPHPREFELYFDL